MFNKWFTYIKSIKYGLLKLNYVRIRNNKLKIVYFITKKHKITGTERLWRLIE